MRNSTAYFLGAIILLIFGTMFFLEVKKNTRREIQRVKFEALEDSLYKVREYKQEYEKYLISANQRKKELEEASKLKDQILVKLVGVHHGSGKDYYTDYGAIFTYTPARKDLGNINFQVTYLNREFDIATVQYYILPNSNQSYPKKYNYQKAMNQTDEKVFKFYDRVIDIADDWEWDIEIFSFDYKGKKYEFKDFQQSEDDIKSYEAFKWEKVQTEVKNIIQ